jgi:cohesin domain-containing protein
MTKEMTVKRIIFLFSFLFACSALAQTVSVSNAAAQCGQSVQVPASIDSVSGLLSLEFRIAYDTSRVTPGNVTAGSLTSGFALSSNASGGVLSIAMASGSPVSGSGNVANITFNVAANASGNAPLTISHVLVNDAARSGNSGALTLTCLQPPDAPTLTAPANGAQNVASPVTLQWSGAAGATAHNVYFGTTATPPFYSSTASHNLQVATQPGTTYYWSVRSTNSAGSATSPTFSFTTSGVACTTPAAPQLNAPPSVTSGDAFELTWNSVAGATMYIVEETDNPASTSVTETHLSLTRTATTERTFYFRVRARNAQSPCNVDGPLSSIAAVRVIPRVALANNTRIIPAVASAEGAFGSFFRTSVQLHNPTSSRITGRLVFHAQGAEGTTSDPSMAYALDAGETKSYRDIVNAIGVARGTGSLDLVPDSGSAVPLSVVRVYNDAGAQGTSGTTLDALVLADAIAAGQRGTLLAPIDPSRARMNIGIRTLLDGVTMNITVRDKLGATIQNTHRSYPPTYFTQVPLSELTNNAVLLGDETIVIEVESGAAMVYGSITDNTTQDPSVQIARP